MVSIAPLRGGARVLPVGRRGRALGRSIGAGLGVSLLALAAWWLGLDDGTPEVPAPAVAVSAPVIAVPATAGLPASATSASTEAPPAADDVRVLGLQQDRHGRWLARLRVGDGAPRLTQVGEGLARGVRVERIAPDGVTVRRGARLEHLPVEGPVARREAPPGPSPESTPAPRTAVIAPPPGQQAPSSDAVERAIGRALERATRRPAGDGTGR